MHKKKTSLLKVSNDLLMASDSSFLTVLVLLDISAAFDTADDSILMRRLEDFIGIKDQFWSGTDTKLAHSEHCKDSFFPFKKCRKKYL